MLAFALSGCVLGSSSSVATVAPSAGPTGGSAPSAASADPIASHPGGAAGCEVTPEASPAATIEMVDRAFGSAATIPAGAAVAFVNRDNTTHSITEGTNGHGAADTCVRQRVRAFETTVIAFALPGDYPITCTIHGRMQTTVHVR